jgi:hypothetical protein
MSVKEITRMIGGDMGTRKDKDFYPTPPWVTEELLSRITLEGSVLEPACGDGAISEVLKKHGYSVTSSDLYDYGYGKSGLDFLRLQEPVENIVTNPPFNLSTKFALHGLNLVSGKMCLFNKLTFLEGKERGSKLFTQNKLEKVIVFSERVNFDLSTGNRTGGMMSFAWFVFDKKYNGKPAIEWV